jgi:hypothetical protein
MEININIENYLTEQEIKEIAKEELSSMIRQHLKEESNIKRIITNVGYEFIFKEISETIGEDSFEKIKNKVVELLEDDSHIKYLLWRKKDAWENEESPAVTILNQSIKDNREKIENKVSQLIDDYDFSEVKDEMYDIVCEAISKQIFGK